MTFTDKNITYVFDFKHATPAGTPRVTTWTFNNDREPSAMIQSVLYAGLIAGQKDGGIAGYEGYFDTDMSFVGGSVVLSNSGINADVSSIWIRMGQSVTSALLKRMILVLEGGSGATLGLRWYKDYSLNSSSTTNIALQPATTGSTAMWGASTSLYGASKFTPIYGLQEYTTPLTGSAKHLKLNISILSNGYNTSIQDLAIISKQGKIR